MKLKDLLSGVSVTSWEGSDALDVQALSYDSRKVEHGSLFCTWKGEKFDGHEFIPEAVRKGAVAIVAEHECKGVYGRPCIQVPSGREALALMAANLYGHPAANLRVVGVTGTNGKTSTALLIRSLLENSRSRSGYIGTVGYDSGTGMKPAVRTTPEGLELQAHLAKMVENECEAAVMEVSSHALDQGRVMGIPFRVAVFTNLSQDHLDYHHSMEEYLQSKLRLFESLEPGQVAVINLDDPHARRFIDVLKEGVEVLRYGSHHGADVWAEQIECTDEGVSFVLHTLGGCFDVKSPWVGRFNVTNILASITAGFALGLPLEEMVQQLSQQPPIAGRMERLFASAPFSVIVDYAHTPDAVAKVLQSLRPLTKKRLRTLVGCGGDRDKTKRPLMAQAACELSDEVIFTSDNPRTEAPSAIIQDMVDGVVGHRNFSIVEDRGKAIQRILNEAEEGDVVLLAGKGHEETQEIHGHKIPFSDSAIALKILGGAQ